MVKSQPTLSYYENLLRTVKKHSYSLSITQAKVEAIYRNRHRYLKIQELTSIPWYWIAAIHHRESSCSFTKHLHNGDSLFGRTTHVPAGRPLKPPSSGTKYTWEESAIDALTMKNLHKNTSWTFAECLMRAEKYNGLGYFWRGVPSPYLWCGTNHYIKGGYPSDGKWSDNYVNKSLGVFCILNLILDLERGISA